MDALTRGGRHDKEDRRDGSHTTKVVLDHPNGR